MSYWTWMVVVALLGHEVRALGEVVRALGQVTYAVYDQSGRPYRTESEEFSIDFDTMGRYLIRLREPRSGSDYYEVGYDGKNSYYLNNLSTVSARARAKDPNRSARNVATGIARASQVPQFSFADCADPLWLTYASGPFFKGRRQDAVVPPAASNGSPDGGGPLSPSDFVELRARFDLAGGRWLQRLAYMHPGKPLRGGGPLPKPLDSGFTNVSFRVDGFAQFGGAGRLPARATMDTYYLSLSKLAIMRRVEYHVECTNASLTERSDFKPAVPGLTAFSDERFNSALAKTLHFAYQTNRWLSDAEASGLPEYQRSAAATVVRPKPIFQRLLIAAVIISVVLVGGYLLLVKSSEVIRARPQRG